MSKVVKTLTGEKDREEGLVIFYCKKKAYQFSLPQYELGADGKTFVLDEKGNRKQNVVYDPNGNNPRKQRKVYEFTQFFQYDRVTGKPDMINYMCKFEITKDEPYRDDLLAYLNSLAKDKASNVMTEEEFIKSLNPQAFEQAKKNVAMQDEIDRLTAKVKELEKKGK